MEKGKIFGFFVFLFCEGPKQFYHQPELERVEEQIEIRGGLHYIYISLNSNIS